jgi:hypothetical protein
VSFAAITLHVASQLVSIVISIYFLIDSVRQLLVTPSYVGVLLLGGISNVAGYFTGFVHCLHLGVCGWRSHTVTWQLLACSQKVVS